MKRETPVLTDELSRRSVLRRSALVTTAGAFGLSSVTGTVAATDFCPRSPGYWHKHWNDSFGQSVDIPPAGSMTKDEIQSRLKAPTKGDKVNIMAKQYLATYLNLLLRPSDDEECAHKAVDVKGIGTVEWEHVKNSAQTWLRQADWDGSEHTGKKDWTPTVSVEGASGEVDGEVLKNALDAFNNNRYDELDCDCDEESSDSDPGDEKDTQDEGKKDSKGPKGNKGEEGPPDEGKKDSKGPKGNKGEKGPPDEGKKGGKGPKGNKGKKGSNGGGQKARSGLQRTAGPLF